MKLFKESVQEKILGSVLESENSKTYTKQKEADKKFKEEPTETPSKPAKLGTTKETGKELGKCYKHQTEPDKEYNEKPEEVKLPKKTATKIGESETIEEEVNVSVNDSGNAVEVSTGEDTNVTVTADSDAEVSTEVEPAIEEVPVEEPIEEPEALEEPTIETESEETLTEEDSARPNEEKIRTCLDGGSLNYEHLCNELLKYLSDDELGEFIKTIPDFEDRLGVVTVGVEESCENKEIKESDSNYTKEQVYDLVSDTWREPEDLLEVIKNILDSMDDSAVNKYVRDYNLGADIDYKEPVQEDEELARKAFVSLQKLDDGSYVILKDGNFQEKIQASSDEEALSKFKEKYSNAKESVQA